MKYKSFAMRQDEFQSRYLREQEPEHIREQRMANRQRKRSFFGIFVAILGSVILLDQLGVFPSFVQFLFQWPYLLMVIGLLIGLRKGFRNNAWWILILIGVCNAIPIFTIAGQDSNDLILPVALIVGGLAFALRPPRKMRTPHFGDHIGEQSEHQVKADIVFGGKKELVGSKAFEGGMVHVVCGGYELNLMQADSPSPMELHLRVVFGSAEIIAPSGWKVKNEIGTTFGSVEDHRTLHTAQEPEKLLILKGSVVFGSVEIKSY